MRSLHPCRWHAASAVLFTVLFFSGCAHQQPSPAATQPVLLPPGVAQPRMRELLQYMARHGISHADEAFVFDFSAWPMYEELSWDENPRKPRFEGANILYADMRITVAISPVKPYHSDGEIPEKVVQTYAKKAKEPNGASVILEGRSWTVGFTMAAPDAKVREQLTEIVREFVHEYAEAESGYEKE